MIEHMFISDPDAHDIDTQVADELDASWQDVRDNLRDAVVAYG